MDNRHYFKIVGKHPVRGPETRYIITQSTDELESWHNKFISEGFVCVVKTEMTANEYVEHITADAIARGILACAVEYISNNPADFGSDSAGIYDVRNSNTLREKIFDKIYEAPAKYQGLSLKEAADVVHAIYVEWGHRY